MNRLLLALIVAGGLIALGVWALPGLKKRFIGESLLVRYQLVSAYPEEVMLKGEAVQRTTVSIELYFPMGSAPDTPRELHLTDDNGQEQEVFWGQYEAADLPDQRVTRWVITDATFPLEFRQGLLKTKSRDLCRIRLSPYPLNAP